MESAHAIRPLSAAATGDALWGLEVLREFPNPLGIRRRVRAPVMAALNKRPFVFVVQRRPNYAPEKMAGHYSTGIRWVLFLFGKVVVMRFCCDYANLGPEVWSVFSRRSSATEYFNFFHMKTFGIIMSFTFISLEIKWK